MSNPLGWNMFEMQNPSIPMQCFYIMYTGSYILILIINEA